MKYIRRINANPTTQGLRQCDLDLDPFSQLEFARRIEGDLHGKYAVGVRGAHPEIVGHDLQSSVFALGEVAKPLKLPGCPRGRRVRGSRSIGPDN